MTTPHIPYISTTQMRLVDELMISEYSIGLLQMMENAGRNLAIFTSHRLKSGAAILVLAGKGGNGGGALCAARHLHNYGFDLHIVNPFSIRDLSSAAAHQLKILKRIGIPIQSRIQESNHYDIIVDGLIGYSLNGDPTEPIASLIDAANKLGPEIISLDNPSGLNVSTGEARNPCIQASYTVTLALPKSGFFKNDGPARCGKIYLADISVPEELYVKMGILQEPIHIFQNSPLIPLT